MSEDKQIQKRPEFSIDNLKAKSYLANRGLRELGLLKDKKHFTIIYVCQFCGRLINFALTPCIFCGNYPETNRETLTTDALSSNSLELPDLLTVSKAIKNHEDLEIVIANLRLLIDEELEKWEMISTAAHLAFKIKTELRDSIFSKEDLKQKASLFIARSQPSCKSCGYKIHIASEPCKNCGADTLTVNERWVVALNSILSFFENELNWEKDGKPLEELIFESVYIINQLIEKEEMPDKGLKDDLKRYLSGANPFYVSTLSNGQNIFLVNPGVEPTDEQLNVSYLLRN